MAYLFHKAWVVSNQITKGWVKPPPPKDEKWKVLVVHAHPLGESLSGAAVSAVETGLKQKGHDVVLLKLYEEKFQPVLTKDERQRYLGPTDAAPNLPAYPTPSRDVRKSVTALQSCDAVVFVYPTWWFNVPAMLKGWLDRCLLPGIAFKIPTLENQPPGPLIPGLQNIKKIGVVTTFGAPRHIAFLAGDNGLNMIARAFLPLCHPDCTLLWHGIFNIDASSPESRHDFLTSLASAYRDNF